MALLISWVTYTCAFQRRPVTDWRIIGRLPSPRPNRLGIAGGDIGANKIASGRKLCLSIS